MGTIKNLIAIILLPIVSIAAAETITVVLQQGLNGYKGCEDKELRDPIQNYGEGPVDEIMKISENCSACPIARALLRFDISAISSNSVLLSAILELYVDDYAGGSTTGDYSIFRIVQQWVENEATWENPAAEKKWTNAGGDFVAQPITKVNFPQSNGRTWIKFNVLSLMRDFVRNPITNYGFLVTNSSWAQEIIVLSSENQNTESRPKLTITYNEEPSVVTHSRHRFEREGVTVCTRQQRLYLDAKNTSSTVTFLILKPDGTLIRNGRIMPGKYEIVSGFGVGVYVITTRQGKRLNSSIFSILP